MWEDGRERSERCEMEDSTSLDGRFVGGGDFVGGCF